MKKITLFAFLILSSFMQGQETFAIYTEDATVGSGISALRFSNGQGFALSETTTAPFEGSKNYLLTFNGSSSYFHAIFFPRNATNTADTSVNLSTYNYYNLSIKTNSAAAFYIRLRGNGVIAKVLIDPAQNSYGFTNDNQWHMISIPIADFIPESSAFTIGNITEILVLRSNITGSTAGLPNNFEIDNIYVSVNEVMSVKNNTLSNIKTYPNPVADVFNFQSAEPIERIAFYNTLGQKVLEQFPEKSLGSIEMSALLSGIYVVSLESNGKNKNLKIVKK